jgi:DNA invertase Pin-like site-specific DNA recombinase
MSETKELREIMTLTEKQTFRAAQYVRMSTEHQQYSTLNQADKIREYADKRGIEIVRTYADDGKSGLSIGGRASLQKLIADVESGNTDFNLILVYDVSRWGRFQDADESAYYEYICKRKGISVAYVAEQFENDGSPVSTIVKGVKRAMAGEFSRELSAKVFAGQCRLIELGFRQGGPAGFGLRRVLIDQSGAIKATLKPGEHKSLQTDRVILVPGPAQEVATVHQIYQWLVEDDLPLSDIAQRLNDIPIHTDLDRPWTYGTVRQVLTNEKYIGNNVYNRRSFKLKRERVVNPPEKLVRKEEAFPAIIEPELFYIAQGIIRGRSQRFSDEDLLTKLKGLYEGKGYLSGILINEAEEMPSASVYTHRFGSLIRAYELVGYRPDRDFAYLEINRQLRRLHPEIVQRTEAGIMDIGGEVFRDAGTDLLTVNGEFTASIVLARSRRTEAGNLRWKIRLDTGLCPDITIAVRLDAENAGILDYYLLPWIDLGPQRLNLAEANGVWLEGYRFDGLEALYRLAARSRIRRAA